MANTAIKRALSYIDTHVHTNSILAQLKIPYAQYKQSMPQNFEGSVTVFCDPKTCDEKYNSTWESITKENDEIHVSFGIHPMCAESYNDEIEKNILRNMDHPKCVAFGEIGLDYHYEKANVEAQQKAFERQLKLAVELKKPLIIHARQTEEECLKYLQRIVPKDHRIHIHCFTGEYQFALAALKLFPDNLFFGVTGIVCYKSAKQVHETVSKLPLSKLLLETDGPYLSPQRGQSVCHSGHIPIIAERIATLRGVDVAEVYQQCRINTKQMYGI